MKNGVVLIDRWSIRLVSAARDTTLETDGHPAATRLAVRGGRRRRAGARVVAGRPHVDRAARCAPASRDYEGWKTRRGSGDQARRHPVLRHRRRGRRARDQGSPAGSVRGKHHRSEDRRARDRTADAAEVPCGARHDDGRDRRRADDRIIHRRTLHRESPMEGRRFGLYHRSCGDARRQAVKRCEDHLRDADELPQSESAWSNGWSRANPSTQAPQPGKLRVCSVPPRSEAIHV